MRWLAKCTEVRVREPELTVQCRGWLPWRDGSVALLDARVECRRVDVAHLSRRVVEHDVGRDPAAVPRTALDVVQRVDAAVLAGVVVDVARHVHLGVVRDAILGTLECVELAAAEDLHAVNVVDVVLHTAGRRTEDRVSALVARCEGVARGRGLDVVHVVAVGLIGRATADQQ